MCKETKPREVFSKDRSRKDGLRTQCKACVNQYKKQWYQENREQMVEYNKQWRQENPEYNKQWRQENSEYFKKRRQENKDMYAEYRARRRALKRDAVPEILTDCPAEKERLVQIYKLRDLLTKATGVEYHVDHIWPLSKGGPHWSGNLQIITAEENLSKNASFCEDTARVIQESLNENTCGRHRDRRSSLRLHKTACDELD